MNYLQTHVDIRDTEKAQQHSQTLGQVLGPEIQALEVKIQQYETRAANYQKQALEAMANNRIVDAQNAVRQKNVMLGHVRQLQVMLNADRQVFLQQELMAHQQTHSKGIRLMMRAPKPAGMSLDQMQADVAEAEEHNSTQQKLQDEIQHWEKKLTESITFSDGPADMNMDEEMEALRVELRAQEDMKLMAQLHSSGRLKSIQVDAEENPEPRKNRSLKVKATPVDRKRPPSDPGNNSEPAEAPFKHNPKVLPLPIHDSAVRTSVPS